MRKKTFIVAIMALLILTLMIMAAGQTNSRAGAKASLNLSKGLVHYADDMEFFYQRPKKETVPQILSSLNKNGALAHGENRLMVAAFLAELANTGVISLNGLAKELKNPGRDLEITLAWSAHLARNPLEAAILASLAEKGDTALAAQIRHAPAPLSAWRPQTEKSVLQMYWAAFMASGNTTWLDAIIRLAMKYGEDRAAGKHSGRDFGVEGAAAASLFELAPRHPLVAGRVEAHLQGASQSGREILEPVIAAVKNH